MSSFFLSLMTRPRWLIGPARFQIRGIFVQFFFLIKRQIHMFYVQFLESRREGGRHVYRPQCWIKSIMLHASGSWAHRFDWTASSYARIRQGTRKPVSAVSWVLPLIWNTCTLICSGCGSLKMEGENPWLLMASLMSEHCAACLRSTTRNVHAT